MEVKKEKKRLYQRAYREKNRDRINELRRKWYQKPENKEKLKLQRIRYYKNLAQKLELESKEHD